MKTITLNSKVKISSPVLDLKSRARMRACIELGAAEIVLALFTEESELAHLEHLLVKPGEKLIDTLTHLAGSSDFFAHSYAQVQVGIAGPHYTLVPAALFDNASKEQLLRFNHALSANDIVLADEVVSAGSFCVYAIDARVKELFDKFFPNNHMRHHASYLLGSLPGLASRTHKTCLVDVHTDSIAIALYDKKLLFFNSFGFQAAEDFLYFVLASLEQNGCALDETDVVLAGEVEAGSAIHNTLKKYIPRLRFAVAGRGVARKGELARLPEHFYFSLYNLYLCAL